MKLTHSPDPAIELGNLSPILPVLFEAFEQATEKAAQFFEGQGRAVDPHVYPCLVRYHVKTYLIDLGQVVADFDREELSNNGLCITIGTRRLRIWKAHNDEFPPLTYTPGRWGFLNQQLPLLSGEFIPHQTKLIAYNLALLWNVDSNYRFWRFFLSCPESASESGTELFWTVPVPHPATNASAEEQITEIPDDDLPFKIRDDNEDMDSASHQS